jgi:hypothetical protein
MTVTRTKKTRNAALEERIRILEEKLSPPAPVPERLAKPPSWAQQSTNVGMAYCGEPSTPQTGDGQVWIKVDPKTGYRKFPDGLLRDDSGNVVPHPIAGVVDRRPVGPPRSPAHEEAVKLLDRLAT